MVWERFGNEYLKSTKITCLIPQYFVKPSICLQIGKYATINTKHFIFQHPYQHFKELWLCLKFLWIISKERNLNAFIPDQTAERFLFTGYAPVKRPSAQVLRKGGLIMGQTKNNGAEPQPDRKILRLSDLYTVRMKETQLELTAVLLNINRNHNRELMEACRDLKDYAEYVDRVRKYARELPLSEAVERAITECIREGILKEFLEKNRAEVKTIPEGRESFFKSGQGVGGGITLMS